MRTIFMLSVLLFTVNGCAGVSGKVTDAFSRDLQRTHELSRKYAKPSVADCTAALLAAIEGAKALREEPISGIVSASFRAALLREHAKVAEEAFIQNCSSVAAKILIELGKQAPLGMN